MTGEQALNWAKATAVTAGIVLGGYSTFIKGEPGAKLAYEKLAEGYNELLVRITAAEAYSRGVTAAGCARPAVAAVAEPDAAPEPDGAAMAAEPDAGPPPPPAPRPRPAARTFPPQLEQLKREFDL